MKPKVKPLTYAILLVLAYRNYDLRHVTHLMKSFPIRVRHGKEFPHEYC